MFLCWLCWLCWLATASSTKALTIAVAGSFSSFSRAASLLAAAWFREQLVRRVVRCSLMAWVSSGAFMSFLTASDALWPSSLAEEIGIVIVIVFMVGILCDNGIESLKN